MEDLAQGARHEEGRSSMMSTRKALLLAAGITLLLQLYLCYFFSFGAVIPMSNDISPANYFHAQYHFPPTGYFLNNYWLGVSAYPQPLTPYSLLAHLPVWLFFTAFYPLCGAMGVLTFYLLLRELELSPWAALAGGVMYGWQGHLLSNIYSGHFAPAAMMAIHPLAVWAALRTTHPQGWRFALAAGALTGMVVAMGTDQGGMAALLVGGVYLAVAGRALVQHSPMWWRILAKLGMTILFAVLVALPQLQLASGFASSEMKPSASEDPRAQYAWATQWSWPPEETLQLLAPGFFGWKSGDPEGPYWGRMGRSEGWEKTREGFRNFSLESSIIGTVPFFLLCAGAWWVWRKPRAPATGFSPFNDRQRYLAQFFCITGVVTYLLSFGKYTILYWFFYQIPYMSTWRNPVKFLLVLSNFCFLVLATYGVQALTELFRSNGQWEPIKRSLRRWLLVIISVLGMALIVSVVGAPTRQQLTTQGYGPVEASAIANLQARSLLAAIAVLGATWWGLGFFQKSASARIAIAVPVLLGALNIAQMYWIQSHYTEPFNARNAYRTNPLLEKISSSPDPVRVKFLSQDPLLHYYLSHAFAAREISTIDVPAASRIPNDYAQFFGSFQHNPARLWQLSGVKYLATDAPHAPSIFNHPMVHDNVAALHAYRASGTRIDNIMLEVVPSFQEATHVLVELKDYLPRALFVPDIEILENETAVAERLDATDWNPRHSLLLTKNEANAGQLHPLPVSPSRRGSARLLRYGKDYIEIEAQTVNGGYLLINDYYDPAWHVRVNGQPTTIFRANILMRGLLLPSGSSRIVLRYQQPSLPSYLSLAAYAVAGIVFLGTRKRGTPVSV